MERVAMQEALRHELSDIHELTTALEAAKSLGPQRPQPRSVLWMMADDLRADAASHSQCTATGLA